MEQSGPTSIPKFFDAESRPPLKGWHYYSDPRDERTYFRAGSAGDVFENVKRLRRNNGTFVSDLDIWRELWTYWCSREPGRCGLESAAAAGAPPRPLAPRELTKDFWGPIIWQHLNLAAVQFESIGRDNFLRVLGMASSLMTCPECIQHWQEILAGRPPSNVTTALEACQWVNDAHNLVNMRRGVPVYPYTRMVVEYGAPLP